MAEFTVEFAEGTLPPPTYDDYQKIESTLCNDDFEPKTIVFNNIGDFVIGLNFSSNYPPAATIKLESFDDVTIQVEIGPGTVTNPAPGSSPSYLYRVSTGQPLVYPYIIPVNELYDIAISSGVTISCDQVGGKYSYQRTRTIGFSVGDSNGLYGDLKSSTLITNGIT